MITVRNISAAAFPDRTIRVWMLEALFTTAQIRSLNTVPQVAYTPPAGYIVLPVTMAGILKAGSVVFSGAVSLGFTVGSTALAAVLAMGTGAASVIQAFGDVSKFDGNDYSAEIGLPLSITSDADRTGGTGASLAVFMQFWTVKASDLV